MGIIPTIPTIIFIIFLLEGMICDRNTSIVSKVSMITARSRNGDELTDILVRVVVLEELIVALVSIIHRADILESCGDNVLHCWAAIDLEQAATNTGIHIDVANTSENQRYLNKIRNNCIN